MGFNSPQMSLNRFPTGVLLNNPGNLKHSHDRWFGQTRLQKDEKFVRFLTPQAGIRAMMKVLLTYQNEHRFCTIAQIITRYAPPGENNTQAYIDDIVIKTGIPENFCLDLSKVENLMTISEYMVVHEQGYAPNSMPQFWYEEKIYHDAAMQALYDEE